MTRADETRRRGEQAESSLKRRDEELSSKEAAISIRKEAMTRREAVLSTKEEAVSRRGDVVCKLEDTILSKKEELLGSREISRGGRLPFRARRRRSRESGKIV